MFLRSERAFGQSALGPVGTARVGVGVLTKHIQLRLDHEISITDFFASSRRILRSSRVQSTAFPGCCSEVSGLKGPLRGSARQKDKWKRPEGG